MVQRKCSCRVSSGAVLVAVGNSSRISRFSGMLMFKFILEGSGSAKSFNISILKN